MKEFYLILSSKVSDENLTGLNPAIISYVVFDGGVFIDPIFGDMLATPNNFTQVWNSHVFLKGIYMCIYVGRIKKNFSCLFHYKNMGWRERIFISLQSLQWNEEKETSNYRFPHTGNCKFPQVPNACGRWKWCLYFYFIIPPEIIHVKYKQEQNRY